MIIIICRNSIFRSVWSFRCWSHPQINGKAQKSFYFLTLLATSRARDETMKRRPCHVLNRKWAKNLSERTCARNEGSVWKNLCPTRDVHNLSRQVDSPSLIRRVYTSKKKMKQVLTVVIALLLSKLCLGDNTQLVSNKLSKC